jgi:hypothetical protein
MVCPNFGIRFHLPKRSCLAVAAALGALLSVAGQFSRAEEQPAARAEEKARDDKARDEERAERLARMVKTAAEYEIAGGKESEIPAELLKEPLLRWSNPLRESDDGTLFLWTLDGRPAVAACVYNVGEGVIEHELQSLAAGPLRATRRKTPVWTPATGGVEFKPVPGDPEIPASTPVRRLNQMRNIMRGFTAAFGYDRWRHELRLMPQPLYRYGTGDGDLVDGALFAFAQGTDPEILLLLEARGTDKESRNWQYAVARMNMGDLDLKHAGEVVWKIAAWDRRLDPRQPYITFAFPRDK